jgi:hypothetical protein
MSADPVATQSPSHGHDWRRIGLTVAVLVGVTLRICAAYSVAGNWDEFGLFEGASKTAETGILRSGGRPGLAQLLVLPLVADCTDEISVVRTARLIWVFFTLAYLTGIGVLIAQLQSDPKRRIGDALLGVGLLCFVPAFLEWSIQVRTDQLALAGGVWGGIALLASRRYPAAGALAGLILGLGFLASQKLVYVAAAVFLMAIAQLWFAREFRLPRELARGLLLVAGFATAVLGFHAIVAHQNIDIANNAAAASGISSSVLRDGLSAFDFYRHTIGFSQYLALAPTLVPHFVMLGALVAATLIGRGRRGAGRETLPLAWALLVLFVAVGLFHGAAFAYFWMTLGLFPALAFAIARRPILDLLPDTGPIRTWAIAGFWVLLAGPGVATMTELLSDTQSVQRQSFDFVHRNFESADAGFHPESGLFCRGEGQPLGHYFSHKIYTHYGRPESRRNPENLIRQFRSVPIRFLVQSFRLNQFPVEIRRFWAENYQPYQASVFVAGRRLAGRAGQEHAFEVVAPGAYQWIPDTGSHEVSIDGRSLGSGEVVSLEAGDHQAHFDQDVPGGILVLALADPPGTAPMMFYKNY